MGKFTKEINFENREELVEYLSNHFRYYTGNAWNRSTSYANNVKLYNLGVPAELQDKAWELVCGELECVDFDILKQDEMLIFQEETGYAAGFNGRSGGYIVMYDTEYKNGQRYVYPYRSIDQDADFSDEEEWSLHDLQERAELVQRFDKMCDYILEGMIYILKNSKIETYEVVTTTAHRRLTYKET